MIGYYVHHQGAGHLRRFRSIAAHLDVPVCGLSSLPPPADWAGPWVRLAADDTPLAPDAWSEADDHDPTGQGTLHWVPRHHPGLARRSAQLTDWVATRRPSLLVADVSVEATLTARLSGLPVVVVAMPGRRDDRAHRLAYDLAQALLAPWPREAHGRHWPLHWTRKAWFVGGISQFDDRPSQPAAEGAAVRTPRRLLVLWGAGGDPPSPELLEGAQRATPGWEWTVRAPGSSPTKDLWSDLAAADVVVTHAGQNAVAEVAAARRPAIVIAQPRPFDEQAATASALTRLGIAVGEHGWPRDAAWPDLLERALRLDPDAWSRWSTGTGARSAAHRLGQLARTLAPAEPDCPS